MLTLARSCAGPGLTSGRHAQPARCHACVSSPLLTLASFCAGPVSASGHCPVYQGALHNYDPCGSQHCLPCNLHQERCPPHQGALHIQAPCCSPDCLLCSLCQATCPLHQDALQPRCKGAPPGSRLLTLARPCGGPGWAAAPHHRPGPWSPLCAAPAGAQMAGACPAAVAASGSRLTACAAGPQPPGPLPSDHQCPPAVPGESIGTEQMRLLHCLAKREGVSAPAAHKLMLLAAGMADQQSLDHPP